MANKSLEEYKVILKDLIIKKGKSIDYYSGYIICLKDHDIMSIEDALELLKYGSDVYFKKKGWK